MTEDWQSACRVFLVLCIVVVNEDTELIFQESLGKYVSANTFVHPIRGLDYVTPPNPTLLSVQWENVCVH